MTEIPIEQLLDRYGGAVPRYTSYPSAVQFRNGYKASLAEEALNLGEVSIYIHIPFCRSLCSYCGCTMRVAHGDEPIADYMKSLHEEIRIAGTETGGRLKARHIHFGGGSPNVLSPAALENLIQLIDVHFNIQDGAEIAMEVDPRRLTLDKVTGYAVAGVNRVSLGVQDFQSETQAAINRVQPYALVESCVEWHRQAGIKNINFDLMYGLPYQTVATVEDNVRKALALEPSRVSVFGYAHVPWMRPHQKILERYPLPGLVDRFHQAEAARSMFLGNAYVAVGMDHYCRPDDPLAKALIGRTLHRNFQGYTTDATSALLGFGLSSISRLPKGYFQNSANFKTYKDTVGRGVLPVEKGCPLNAEDLLRAALIEELMCYFAVDAASLACRHGFPGDFFAANIGSLREMQNDGLVEVDGSRLQITETGRPFVRAVCAVFDSYLEQGGKRHARAV